MLMSLWRRLGMTDLISCRGTAQQKGLHPSFRPKLEALEDRTLPAPLVPAILPAASEGTTAAASAPPSQSVATGPSAAVSVPPPSQSVATGPSAAASSPPPQSVATGPSAALGSLPPVVSETGSAVAHQTMMMVMENTPKSIIDLGPIFAETSGIDPEKGLQLSLLGNTNPGLVTPELSEGELTLSYTPSKSGTATITVGATEADGSCVRENILVTVLPLLSTTAGSLIVPSHGTASADAA
jgi:hypothetical protein